MSATKYCGRCELTLPVSMFARNSVKKDGLQERCTECRKNHHQAYKHLRKKTTPEQKRKHLLSGKYNLSVDDFNALLEKQGHTCAICKTKDWGRPSPSVDHCHATGIVRGLLLKMSNEIIDMINSPPHYRKHPSGVECIQITEHMSFNLGNAVKYLWRADEKGAPLDDLRKCLWYIAREIQKREKKEAP